MSMKVSYVPVFRFQCCSTLPIEELNQIAGAVPQVGPFKMACPDSFEAQLYDGDVRSVYGGLRESKIVCEPGAFSEIVKSIKKWIFAKTIGSDVVEPLLPITAQQGASWSSMQCRDASDMV